MNSLNELISKTTNQTRLDLLESCIAFPKTASLNGNIPLKTYEYNEVKVDYDQIVAFVEKDHQDLSSIPFKEDVVLILKLLQDVHDHSNLSVFDSIQIYHGGINILRIVNKDKGCGGLSICIDIIDYRRRLQKYFYPDYSYTSLAMVGIFVGVMVVGLKYIVSYFSPKKS